MYLALEGGYESSLSSSDIGVEMARSIGRSSAPIISAPELALMKLSLQNPRACFLFTAVSDFWKAA